MSLFISFLGYSRLPKQMRPSAAPWFTCSPTRTAMSRREASTIRWSGPTCSSRSQTSSWPATGLTALSDASSLPGHLILGMLSHFTARRRFLQTSHLLRPPATKILPTATQPLWRLVFIPRGLRRRPEGDRGHQTHHLLLHWPSCPHCWSCPLLVVF